MNQSATADITPVGQMAGVIISFNGREGKFGFFQPDEVHEAGGEVLLAKSLMKLHDPTFGTAACVPGTRVTCEVGLGPKGLRATEVVGYTAAKPQKKHKARPVGKELNEELLDCEVVCTVKFFAKNGFGFLVPPVGFEGGKDIFIHRKAVKEMDIDEAALTPGTEVLVRQLRQESRGPAATKFSLAK